MLGRTSFPCARVHVRVSQNSERGGLKHHDCVNKISVAKRPLEKNG